MALKAVFDNIISKAAIDFSSSEIIDIVSAVEEMVHRFARNVTENTPDLKILRVLPCGSMREKSALWKTFVNNPRRPVVFEGIGEVPYIEFDFLAILEKPPEIEFTPTDCPGCNQVKHTPNERKRCSTDLKIYNGLGNMCSVSETSSGAVRARRICSRCETAFHGSLPWWPFDNWKTWKKVGSEEYLCTDLVDALFHNVVVSNMCPPCSCLRVSVKEVDCALIDCSNRKRCKVTRNKANRNIKCEKCTVVKDSGFLQLAVTSEANMMSHKRNKCSFILLWTSSSDKLSSFEPKELEWKKIDQLHVLVDFLPAFEVAHGKFHEEALLVAKGCSCCSDCCKWRVSYAVKEMDAILFETSEDHKKCYKIIKYIIHLFHYFDLNINSYHVKTVFLKHCKDCKIADGSFDKCINEVLLGLSIAYKTGHLEGFVNKSNLIKWRCEGFARELELVEQMFKEFETEFEVDGIDSSLLTQTLIGHLKQILLYFKTENDKITDTEPYHWHPDSYVRFGWQHTKKGFRSNAAKTDFSKILEEEMEQAVKDAAEISMGTEISAEDLLIVNYLSEQLLNEKKLQQTENLYLDFESPEKASQVVKLKHFKKFQDTTEALAAATATIEGKMSKALKSLMKKVVAKEAHEELLVADAKLGNVIKDKFDVSCMANSSVQELMRGIRQQMDSLISLPEKEMSAMALGLAHSLSRYKLKFSPDKVDTMIVQAISLLDDLDKELNNYVMRAREWYGWHFPELGKIIADNLAYAKTVILMGFRTNAAKTDFSKILEEEVEQEVKDAAEISMGTEISDEDLLNVKYLCEQVIEISEYRTQLYDYIKNRMIAVAPNLTVLVGELVGARLISHAGSLMNLAKHPASTVQILGAEKSLFRALKTKHDTPKYGLIYHAQLVGQANMKMKGKMSRMLAAKTALAIRVDALGEETNADLGLEHRAKLETRLKHLEERKSRRISGTGKAQAKWEKYENKSQIRTYNETADSTLPNVPTKRKFNDEDEEKTPHKTPKIEPISEPELDDSVAEKKKKKKKKKKHDESVTLDTTQESIGSPETGGSEKKKKKKKKVKAEPDSD